MAAPAQQLETMFVRGHCMRVAPIFRDRFDAGRILAEKLYEPFRGGDALVLALPRGGVPVAFEVARALGSELDVFLVRKLGLPGQEELAVGAIATGGVRVLNHALLSELQLSPKIVDQITAREEVELNRREELYRQGRPPTSVECRLVILVDDGLATGASMKAATEAIRSRKPERLVVAVPVAAEQACDEFRMNVDQIVCAYTREPFIAVGVWYEEFSQTSDEEVQQLLSAARSFAVRR